MRTTTVHALMSRFSCFLLCLAFSGQLEGRGCEMENWRFVAPWGGFTTNVLEEGLSSVVRRRGLEKGIEFRLTDKAGNESVRGWVKKFESYARLYSMLYGEISNSAMPKRLLLSSMDMDVSGGMGDVCVRGKKWNAASSKFQTTEKPKYVYYTVGTFMVNVCGNENEVMRMAVRIAACLAAFAKAECMGEVSPDSLCILAARRCVCGIEENVNGEFRPRMQVFRKKGQLTAVGAWLSLALLDNHMTSGKMARPRSAVALQLLNESQCFSPPLSLGTIGGVADALSRTFGAGCDNPL